MDKKTALITGASRGIGKETARQFAKAGYDLYLTCINNIDFLTEYAQSLSQSYGISCKAYKCDVSVSNQVDELFSSIGSLTVLVNNAGISYFGLLSEMDDESWSNVISTNLNSVFYCCRKAVPLMLKSHCGSIVNVSSVWGQRGASMEVAYCASKGGVDSLTKALAKELAISNISVNAISCGLIDTDMNSHLTDEEIQEIVNEIPADRIGQPSEVAETILRIAESPSYLTGQIIGIDGGWR